MDIYKIKTGLIWFHTVSYIRTKLLILFIVFVNTKQLLVYVKIQSTEIN